MTDYELTIIGGGPAGVAAAVYAARKELKTLFITENFNSQSIVSPDIQNWVGDCHLPGAELARRLEAHVREYAAPNVTLAIGERATALEKHADQYTVTYGNATATTKAVIIASGSNRRRLDIPGADRYEHKGLTYCASCDGPLFSGQDVAVIGGGNSAFEAAAQLLAYTKSVTLLHRRDSFRADPVTVQKVSEHKNFHLLTNVTPTKIVGDVFIQKLCYRNTVLNTENDLAITGLFVEIGAVPNTGFVDDLVETTDSNNIVVDPWTMQTSAPGIWAAGDCTNAPYQQNNIAAGQGVSALEDAYLWLRAQ